LGSEPVQHRLEGGVRHRLDEIHPTGLGNDLPKRRQRRHSICRVADVRDDEPQHRLADQLRGHELLGRREQGRGGAHHFLRRGPGVVTAGTQDRRGVLVRQHQHSRQQERRDLVQLQLRTT
jgi:hypothetical protein